MENEQKTYTPVADGYHDCRIAFCKRAEKHYGREIKNHIVFEFRLVPTDCPDVENPASYRAEFPVMLIPGFEWDFFDEKTGRGVWRPVKVEDTTDALEYAKKCFPAWAEYCEELTDDGEDLAFAWFADKDRTEPVRVRAKLKNAGTYTGTDGNEYPDLKAKIIAPFEVKPIVAEGESAQIAKALKAAGVKLFGKTSAAKPTANAKPTAPKPPKPVTPPKPKKTIDQAREEAVTAYCANHADDPQCAKFYERAAEALKRDINSWESWTVKDWEEITKVFEMPF